MNFQVRRECKSDEQAISDVVMAAFGKRQGQEISNLIADLTKDSSAQPLLSLVATANDNVGGRAFALPE